MKIRIWLLTRERETWITATELLGLALILLTDAGGVLRLLVGLPLLGHVGYKALTSLPMGRVPGRPDGSKSVRRNLDLRSRVVGFLNEMRRVEDFAHQAVVGGRPQKELERDLVWAKKRMMAAAEEVVRAAGRPVVPSPMETDGVPRATKRRRPFDIPDFASRQGPSYPA